MLYSPKQLLTLNLSQKRATVKTSCLITASLVMYSLLDYPQTLNAIYSLCVRIYQDHKRQQNMLSTHQIYLFSGKHSLCFVCELVTVLGTHAHL